MGMQWGSRVPWMNSTSFNAGQVFGHSCRWSIVGVAVRVLLSSVNGRWIDKLHTEFRKTNVYSQ